MKIVYSHRDRGINSIGDSYGLARVINSPSTLIKMFTKEEVDAGAAQSYITDQTSKGYKCHSFGYEASYASSSVVREFSAVA